MHLGIFLFIYYQPQSVILWGFFGNEKYSLNYIRQKCKVQFEI